MSILAVGLALKSQIKSPTCKFVLVAVANYADEDNKCWPSQRRLALDTGYTKRTITSSLQWLESNKYLTREKRSRADGSQSSDIFIVNVGGESISPPLERPSPGSELHSGGGGETASTGGEPVAILEPSNNHQTDEPSKNQDWPRDYAELFWQAYPRKVGKKAAFKRLALVKRQDAVPWKALLVAIGNIRATEIRFIPYPATWLNAGQWDDEPEETNGRHIQAGGNIIPATENLLDRINSFSRTPDLCDRESEDAVRLLSKG